MRLENTCGPCVVLHAGSGRAGAERSGGSRHELGCGELWHAGFDSSQCVAVEDPFPAGRALVKLEVSDRVGLSLDFAGPGPADLLDPIASASRTKYNLCHM